MKKTASKVKVNFIEIMDNLSTPFCIHLCIWLAACELAFIADDVNHIGIMRKANITRDRESALARLTSYNEKEFKRRFRMWRYQFDILLSCIREELEPKTWWAKQCAINSSGSWVRAELKIAATLRVLAGGSYLDAAELYAVEETSFHKNTFWPTIIAICNCKDERLDNIRFPIADERKLRHHEKTFARCDCDIVISYLLLLYFRPLFYRFHKHFPGTVAAGDGCAFKIRRPNEKEVQEDVQRYAFIMLKLMALLTTFAVITLASTHGLTASSCSAMEI
jgi:hypothetical protein